MTSWHWIIGLAIATAVGGCADRLAKPTANSAAATFPYDGTYSGAVKVVGVASGGDIKWCNTDPQMNITISQGIFSYSQAHPDVPFTANTGNTTMLYSGSVDTDGTVRGQNQAGGVITGIAAGKRISGEINGVGCFYTFSVDKP